MESFFPDSVKTLATMQQQIIFADGVNPCNRALVAADLPNIRRVRFARAPSCSPALTYCSAFDIDGPTVSYCGPLASSPLRIDQGGTTATTTTGSIETQPATTESPTGTGTGTSPTSTPFRRQAVWAWKKEFHSTCENSSSIFSVDHPASGFLSLASAEYFSEPNAFYSSNLSTFTGTSCTDYPGGGGAQYFSRHFTFQQQAWDVSPEGIIGLEPWIPADVKTKRG
ncbi:hypothetical protein DFJ74DRAFT_672803 [Hyaloraphidium curvatum]|nr:hypothetical protein DFJ74DRAFT_672803 [Hyaloraphidium curvatum]